ncbi:MAG: sulfite exporter TauE/SafE family protein [Myxococcota bacterium]
MREPDNAGATGFLGALAGVGPETARPTAFLANILVATVATATFRRAGLVDFRVVLPFVVGSVPAAFAGGLTPAAHPIVRGLVAAVLLLAALGMIRRAPTEPEPSQTVRPGWLSAMAVGSALGLLAGVTGTGGGVVLGPVLLAMGWASPREVAGITPPFILANAVAGLGGAWSGTASIAPDRSCSR